ncbi:MAG: hypothetical protein AABZ15_04515 [Nitrospirota bacterium]
MTREDEGLRRELSVKGTADPEYVRGQKIKVTGQYYGVRTLEDEKYYAVKLSDMRNNCGRNHDVILYLPAVAGIFPLIKEDLGFEGPKLQNVDVILIDDRDTHVPAWPDKKYEEPFMWNGYPDKVLIYYSNTEPGMTVHYRFGAADRDIDLLYIKNELEWQCRSKSSYYATHVLYPFAVVYDVVTFPLQWIAWQIWH